MNRDELKKVDEDSEDDQYFDDFQSSKNTYMGSQSDCYSMMQP